MNKTDKKIEKIYIPNIDLRAIGGGWSFTRNFIELAKDALTDNLHDADVMFVTSPTLCTRDEFYKAKELGKRVILRVDGVPEDARNRGTGWSRLRDFAKDANIVIFQSKFVAGTIGRLLTISEGRVIYNGVDQSVFYKKDVPVRKDSILYVNFRKSEQNKRVEEAIERFRYLKVDKPDAFMTFVGQFSKPIKEWNFWMLDYERGKDWDYKGIIADRNELADIMRENEYIAFPSFADPCPNTLIEAMSCGCKPLWINQYGGQAEIVEYWDIIDWSRERMVKQYLKVLKG